MESGRYLFDPSLCSGTMLFLGSANGSLLRGARSLMGAEESSKRWPFFSSPEELYDEEYYDEQMPEKKRRLTAEQVHLLEKNFEEENKLEPERKTQLAKKLGLQPRQVAVWFQNRRARWKTKQLERDYDLLKASYDSLLMNYDSTAKENEKLKSEVVSLTEKLQAKDVTGRAPAVARRHDLPLAEIQPSSTKVEDRLSSGSGGSAVMDEDRQQQQLLDSGDSYFDYPGSMAPVDGVQSEEDDRSVDGQSYFPDDVFAAAASEQEEGEPVGWWVWS